MTDSKLLFWEKLPSLSSNGLNVSLTVVKLMFQRCNIGSSSKERATTTGLTMPNVIPTFTRTSLVAVAVKASIRLV